MTQRRSGVLMAKNPALPCHLKSSNTLAFAGSLGLMSLPVLSPNRLRTSNDRR